MLAEINGVSALRSHGSVMSLLNENHVTWALGMIVHHPQLRDLLGVGDHDDPLRRQLGLSTQILPTLPQVLEQFTYSECARLWRSYCQRHHDGRDFDELGIRTSLSAIELAYETLDRRKLSELIDESFNERYAQQNPDEARAWIIGHVLRPALVEWPVRWAVQKNEGVVPLVLEWTRRIAMTLDSLAEADQEPEGPFTTVQFREQIHDREELVGGVLVAHQLGLVAAATKSLKTVCMLDMAISLATATPWLGNDAWPCRQPKRVLFCSAESGQETLIQKHDVISTIKRTSLPAAAQEPFCACWRKTCSGIFVCRTWGILVLLNTSPRKSGTWASMS